MYYAEMCTAIS